MLMLDCDSCCQVTFYNKKIFQNYKLKIMMKKKLFFFLAILSLFWVDGLQAQNKVLSGEAAATVNQSSARVTQLINASDITTMLPTLEMYREVIEDMPYSNFEMRQENLANLENNYAEQITILTGHINEFRQKAEELGLDYANLNIIDFQMKVKRDHDFFQGGNAIITIEGKEGKQHRMLVNGLYFMAGQWYVLKNIVLL